MANYFEGVMTLLKRLWIRTWLSVPNNIVQCIFSEFPISLCFLFCAFTMSWCVSQTTWSKHVNRFVNIFSHFAYISILCTMALFCIFTSVSGAVNFLWRKRQLVMSRFGVNINVLQSRFLPISWFVDTQFCFIWSKQSYLQPHSDWGQGLSMFLHKQNWRHLFNKLVSLCQHW